MKKSLTLLVLLQCSITLFGQWTTNTALNTLSATAETGDLQSIGASDGSTYIAFWHNVPAPKNYEMRLQRLDVNGNLMFGPEGMLVNNTVPMSSFTTTWSMAIDKNDNVYIGFNGSAGNNAVYVHKITPSGTQTWGNNGVIIGAGFDVKMLPLSSGDVVIFWLPGDKGIMQKVNQFGVTQWPNPITIQSQIPTHKTSAGEMLELSDGGFEVIIHDRSGSSTSALPYAQRYNSNGQPQWLSPIALSNGYYTDYNRRYPLVQDGDILYFGFTGAQGIQPYAFLQRINPNGTVPWGINGVRFSSQSANFEQDIKIAFAPGSAVIWGICAYSDPSQGEMGEFVQKFDKGSGLRLLTDEGKEVYPIGPALISHRGSLQIIDQKPLFIVSDGDSNGVFPKDLLAVYLDENGDFVWPEKTHPIATNVTGVKSRIQFNHAFQQQATCVWAEERNGAVSRPFAQNVPLILSGTSSLEANYQVALIPNPNPGTFSIQMDMPKAERLVYSIFAADGHLILKETKLLDSGRQQILVKDLNLIPGVYFIRLVIGEQNTVIKMLTQ